MYAKAVYASHQSGRLVLHPMTTPTLVLQVLAAWGLTELVGFSFLALRLMTAFLGVLSLLAVFALAREFGLEETESAMVGLGIAMNPLFAWLFNSFMTDVGFLLLVVLSLLFSLRGLKGRPAWLVFGSLFAAAAFLLRQVGLTLTVATVMTLAYQDLRSKRFHALRYFAACALPLLVVAVYYAYGAQWGAITWAHRYRVAPVTAGGLAWAAIPADLLRLAIHALIMAFLIVAAVRRPERGWARVFQNYGRLALGVMGLAAAVALVEFLRHGTTLFIGGLLGWMGLSKVAHLWSAFLYVALGFLLLCAAPAMLAALRRPSLAVPAPEMLLLLLAVAGLALPFALHSGFKDERYVLPLLPLTALIWLKVSPWRRSLQMPAVVLMVVMCLGSCMIVRAHYNAAALQWTESDRLVAEGVTPQSIRSSLGWDAWNTWAFCFDREARGLLTREHYFPCWTERDVPLWRIKMTRALGMRIGRQDPGFREVRKMRFTTFGLPGELTFLLSEAAPLASGLPAPAGP